MKVTDDAFDVVLPASLDAMHLYFSDFFTFLIERLSPSLPWRVSHCSPSMELASHLYIIGSLPVVLQLKVTPTVVFATLLTGWLVIMGGPVNNKKCNIYTTLSIVSHSIARALH